MKKLLFILVVVVSLYGLLNIVISVFYPNNNFYPDYKSESGLLFWFYHLGYFSRLNQPFNFILSPVCFIPAFFLIINFEIQCIKKMIARKKDDASLLKYRDDENNSKLSLLATQLLSLENDTTDEKDKKIASVNRKIRKIENKKFIIKANSNENASHIKKLNKNLERLKKFSVGKLVTKKMEAKVAKIITMINKNKLPEKKLRKASIG
jgi:hypothetical protein